MRILLFLGTNLAVLVLVGLVFNLLGFSGVLDANGVDLNLSALLVFCALFGFGGSIISLLLSKWMAKRGTGTVIIENPGNKDEQWLLDTVSTLATQAGIKMPEVGVFPSSSANAFATGWNRNDALVAVSSGLLQRFSPNEVRAVLAHELGIAHVVGAPVCAPPAFPILTLARIYPFLRAGDIFDGRIEPDVEHLALHPRPVRLAPLHGNAP